MNINSIRYKFEPIKDLLHQNLVDILFLSETKIDESFPNAQFGVDNFTMWRADRNQHGGGLIAYVRSDLAADRKIQLEFSYVESNGIEVAIGNKKWFFCGIYKLPKRCAGGPKLQDFWPTVKSFLTNKGNVQQKETVLSENNVLITKQEEVCEIFNDYFVNVAKNIGSSQRKVDDDHPSILAIKDNLPDLDQNSFTFSPIDQDFVEKRIRKINVKKKPLE
ncbi:unnamed protein product [Mytilus coruscus]|uniref:Endonuclease/exonuclease/phosphatase domain-containing protein n=1 Tax=Mytilus coruscus TaxID=42192 RepID=A0A6J8EP17_MYTCO|nr:unnamed protein product [Mytilus coruscus]